MHKIVLPILAVLAFAAEAKAYDTPYLQRSVDNARSYSEESVREQYVTPIRVAPDCQDQPTQEGCRYRMHTRDPIGYAERMKRGHRKGDHKWKR